MTWTRELARLGGSKDVRQLLADLARRGDWEGRLCGTQHIMLRHARGALVTLAATPSDQRAMRNMAAMVKRAEARE